MATPTANEQYMLELINRARLDPAGEAARFGIGLNKGLAPKTIDPSPKQPLAWNAALYDAARDHSQWMLNKDTFSHTGAGGSNGGDRMKDAGYKFTGNWDWGEDISMSGTTGSLNLTASIRVQHKSLFKSGGHRKNLLDDSFREIGVAQVKGVFTDGQNYTTSMITQDLAKSGSSVFVTGVMYKDKDGDQFYSVGEGTSGVDVEVGSKSTSSRSAGGYQLKCPKGSVEVTLAKTIVVKVDTSGGNAKLDLIGKSIIESSASLKLLEGIDHARLLGVGNENLTGSEAKDKLIGNAGKNKIAGMNGGDTLKGGEGKDTLKGGSGGDVLAGGKGADTLKGGQGADSLRGGKGKDTATGGAGADIFVFAHNTSADRVVDFAPGTDRLDLTDVFGSRKKALNATEDSGAGHAVIDLGSGDKVKLVGVSTADLSVEDFI
ncbi:MAG: hypothetical protein GY798_25135 [Hyphomicrobiales bacterium]|nr:hypothetical protein [Hyphomicrobiales bacterium]